MHNVISFLSDLYYNNNREWFQANKSRYNEALSTVNTFAERLIEGVSAFDSNISGLTLKDCTYRIYRDVRFSHDKSPYKTHFGIYLCKGGKKSWNAGYYMHIEPIGSSYFNGHFLSSGLYMPDSKALKIIREDLSIDPSPFLSAVKKAKGFSLNTNNKLKRIPTGFSEEDPQAELIKQKDYFLEKPLPQEILLNKEELLNYVLDSFRKTKDMIDLLNRAVEYSQESI